LDPNEYPGSEVGEKDDDMDDWMIYLIVVVVLIIILLILVFALRYYNKLRAEEANKQAKVKDDGYFEVKDKDELGIGGELLGQDDVEYYKKDRLMKPEKEIVSDEEMIDCPKCGAKLDVYTDYCYECGEVLKKKKDKKKDIKTKKKDLSKLKSKTNRKKPKKSIKKK
jgi:flagellar biosynthesis/type III secretory pathway M-ring protein FliF/YscJ